MADKPDRNDPCYCGSGRKYKNCCLDKNGSTVRPKLEIAGLVIAVVIGLLIVGMTLFGGEDPPDCPSGTTWSETHQHCH